jgi:hypothetical protein
MVDDSDGWSPRGWGRCRWLGIVRREATFTIEDQVGLPGSDPCIGQSWYGHQGTELLPRMRCKRPVSERHNHSTDRSDSGGSHMRLKNIG